MNSFIEILNKIPSGTTALVAFGSLIISLIALVRPWIKEFLDSHKANISVSFKEAAVRGLPSILIVSNSGVADAKDIKIKLTKTNGEDFNIFFKQEDSTVSLLARNSEIHIPVIISKYQNDRITSTVEWTDKRIKGQSRKNTLGFWS